LSSILSALLSTVWLSNKHINMMMEELAARLATDPDIASKVIIAPLAFQIQINNNAKVKTYTKNNSPLLHRYHKEGVERIYFPINVNRDHWIAGVVNVQAQSVGYSTKQLNKV
jgi:Ulp1 protease family, C-terminal catalytic domain